MPTAISKISKFVFCLLVFVPASTRLSAQDLAERTGEWRVGPFMGFAKQSPVTRSLGTTPGRSHLFVGAHAQTSVFKSGAFEVSYSAQLLPYVRFHGRELPNGYEELTGKADLNHMPETVSAMGFSPFGIEFSLARDKRIGFFAATSAGGLYFARPYPVPEAGKFNFTLEYGAGALVQITPKRWLRAGYKYHHLSNAFTARMNPGVDGNVWYAGLEWGFELPR